MGQIVCSLRLNQPNHSLAPLVSDAESLMITAHGRSSSPLEMKTARLVRLLCATVLIVTTLVTAVFYSFLPLPEDSISPTSVVAHRAPNEQSVTDAPLLVSPTPVPQVGNPQERPAELSAVIPACGDDPISIRLALEALLRVRPALEVVCVQCGTNSIERSLAFEELSKSFPSVTFLPMDGYSSKLSVVHAFNNGVGLVKSPILLLLREYAVVTPGAPVALLAALRGKEDILVPRIILSDNTLWSAGYNATMDAPDGASSNVPVLYHPHMGLPATAHASAQPLAASDSCLLLTRRLFGSLGGFDASVGCGFDADLCLRSPHGVRLVKDAVVLSVARRTGKFLPSEPQREWPTCSDATTMYNDDNDDQWYSGRYRWSRSSSSSSDVDPFLLRWNRTLLARVAEGRRADARHLHIRWDMECAAGRVMGLANEATNLLLGIEALVDVSMTTGSFQSCKREYLPLLPAAIGGMLVRLERKYASYECENGEDMVLVVHRDPGRYEHFVPRGKDLLELLEAPLGRTSMRLLARHRQGAVHRTNTAVEPDTDESGSDDEPPAEPESLTFAPYSRAESASPIVRRRRPMRSLLEQKRLRRSLAANGPGYQYGAGYSWSTVPESARGVVLDQMCTLRQQANGADQSSTPAIRYNNVLRRIFAAHGFISVAPPRVVDLPPDDDVTEGDDALLQGNDGEWELNADSLEDEEDDSKMDEHDIQSERTSTAAAVTCVEKSVGDYGLVVGRSMYETTRVPADWVIRANSMVDTIWVPSKFNIQSFSASGIHTHLADVPEPVHVDIFNAHSKPGKLKIPGASPNSYRFLIVAKWESRKNIRGALRAYFSAFPQCRCPCASCANGDWPSGQAPAVHLVIRANLDQQNRNSLKRFVIEQALLAQNQTSALCERSLVGPVSSSTQPLEREALELLPLDVLLQGRDGGERADGGCSLTGLPPVSLFSSTMPLHVMPLLYESVDALVAPTRGEGWGLPIVEAMAMGLPVMVTNWSGVTSYATDRIALMIPTNGLIPATVEGHEWANPSEAALRAYMRRLARSPSLGQSIGARASEHIRGHYSNQAVGHRLVDRLVSAWKSRGVLRAHRQGRVQAIVSDALQSICEEVLAASASLETLASPPDSGSAQKKGVVPPAATPTPSEHRKRVKMKMSMK